MISEILDRYGNLLTVARDSALRITQIISPNGRSMTVSYDSTNPSRISQVQDNIGRTVGYQYDASGRLAQVTDPENGTTEYTYDIAHRMLTITDARGILYLTNTYEREQRPGDRSGPRGWHVSLRYHDGWHRQHHADPGDRSAGCRAASAV